HKVELIYKNPTGDIERKNCNFTIDDEEVTIKVEKIYVERAEFRIHGIERAYKIKSDAIDIDSYVVQTDIDEKFDFTAQNSTITSTEKGSYTDYFITLNKEEIFYKFKVLSEANIFIKDMLSGNYIEFKENAGVLESDKSYLVKEFLVRSYNHLSKESLLENIKGYRLSGIKLAVDNLKIEEVTFDYLLNLESSIVESEEYFKIVNLAKKEFISTLETVEIILPTNKDLPIKNVVLNFNEEIETIFEYKIIAKNLSGTTVEIDNFTADILQNRKEVILSFEDIYSTELVITLKVSEVEVSKFAIGYEEYRI
ncbi:MAG: hypothetical protein ACRC5F_01090, partial [Cetobacterium sp.]